LAVFHDRLPHPCGEDLLATVEEGVSQILGTTAEDDDGEIEARALTPQTAAISTP